MTLEVGEVKGPFDFFGRERMLIGLRHPADIYHGGLDLTALASRDLASLKAIVGSG
jgi:hypothetical protein